MAVRLLSSSRRGIVAGAERVGGSRSPTTPVGAAPSGGVPVALGTLTVAHPPALRTSIVDRYLPAGHRSLTRCQLDVMSPTWTYWNLCSIVDAPPGVGPGGHRRM